MELLNRRGDNTCFINLLFLSGVTYAYARLPEKPKVNQITRKSDQKIALIEYSLNTRSANKVRQRFPLVSAVVLLIHLRAEMFVTTASPTKNLIRRRQMHMHKKGTAEGLTDSIRSKNATAAAFFEKQGKLSPRTDRHEKFMPMKHSGQHMPGG